MGNTYSHESEDDISSSDKLNSWFQAVDSYARRDALGMAKNNMSFESVVSLSAHSSHSSASSDPWGWFTEDVEYRFDAKGASNEVVKQADAQVAAEEEAKAQDKADTKDGVNKGESMAVSPDKDKTSSLLIRTLSLPSPAYTPPQYVLESSIEYQHLWYLTAGRRPPQPNDEREEIMQAWAENFRKSEVMYPESPPSSSEKLVHHYSNHGHGHGHGGDRESKQNIDAETGLEVIYTAVHPNSYSVSKSFVYDELAAMSVSLPKFRVVKDENDVYAEFLVEVSVCGQGSGSAILFGIWRRHSQFQLLAKRIRDIQRVSLTIEKEKKKAKELLSQSQSTGKHSKKAARRIRKDAEEDPFEEDPAARVYENSLISWSCVVDRQQWYRCLEKDYLHLKCFLLERFMHDVLFESSSSLLLRRFLELD